MERADVKMNVFMRHKHKLEPRGKNYMCGSVKYVRGIGVVFTASQATSNAQLSPHPHPLEMAELHKTNHGHNNEDIQKTTMAATMIT